MRDGNVPQKIVKRAKIVLMTADGAGVMTIMRAVGVSKTTVWRWQNYFVEAGVAGLVKGRTKPPGKKPIANAIKLKIVEKTVKVHRARVMEKMRAGSLAELVRLADEAGIIAKA